MPQILPAKLNDGATVRTLRLRVDHSVRGLHLARTTADSGCLTSVHQLDFEHTLHRTISGRSILTRENPFLTPAALENLDDAGLVRPGVVIDDETILASVLETIEIDIGRPPPSPGTVRAKDDSLMSPPGWGGAVVAAAKYDSQTPVGVEPPKNLMGQIAIRLLLAVRISVGDVLLLRGQPSVIANISESTDADIIVDASIGRALEMSIGQVAEFEISVGLPAARSAMASLSTGPYSLITQRPLKLKSSKCGQPMTPAHVHSLAASGMNATLGELVTLKSDDVAGRMQLDSAIHGRSAFPSPGTPETFRVMLAELACLGLKPRLQSVGSHSELFLRPMTDVDRLGCSAGSIAKSETLNVRTLNPVPQGLFCLNTFGAEDTPERRWRFGHIELPDPIVPWIFRIPTPDGGPSILSRAMGISDNQIDDLLDHRACLDEDGEIANTRVYWPERVSGALAIERRLRTVPVSALPKCMATLANPRSALVARTVLILPPALRPLILLSRGSFATSDLNELYRGILNRVNRLGKLREFNAPEVIVWNESRELQKAADRLFSNTFLPQAEQSLDDSGRPLKDLLNIALTRLTAGEGKRTDYSGSARCVALLSVPPDRVLLPAEMARTLQMRPGAPALITRLPREDQFAVPLVPLKVQIHDHPVIGLHPTLFNVFFPSSVDVSECIVHRPMTPEVVEEMVARIGKVQVASAPPRPSWAEERDLRVLLGTFLNSAMNGARLPFDSPEAILLAGAGSARFSIHDPPPSPPISHARPPDQRLIEIPITWDDAS